MKQRLQGIVIGVMCASGLVFAKQIDETTKDLIVYKQGEENILLGTLALKDDELIIVEK